jgi:hypothetical protein
MTLTEPSDTAVITCPRLSLPSPFRHTRFGKVFVSAFTRRSLSLLEHTYLFFHFYSYPLHHLYYRF